MAMYISIGDGNGPPGAGWSTSGGVFDCIVESTRMLFRPDEQCCLSDIYARWMSRDRISLFSTTSMRAALICSIRGAGGLWKSFLPRSERRSFPRVISQESYGIGPKF